MKEEQDKLIWAYENNVLDKNGCRKLIDMLLNPKRDLDTPLHNNLRSPDKHIIKSKRSMERKTNVRE